MAVNRNNHSRLKDAWSELGWGGRVALAVIIGSTLVAIVLGIEIPRAARHHLLDGRAIALHTVAQAAIDEAPVLGDEVDEGVVVAFDEAVRSRLLGGETFAATLWASDGTILYSSDTDSTRQSKPLPADARTALDGTFQTSVRHPETPDATTNSIIDYYIAVEDPVTSRSGVFGISQRSGSLDAAVGQISRTVWISTAAGLGLLLVFLSSVVMATARGAARRRRHTEQLLGQALVAQESERKRIVGALHSDVGQRLYRVLYGLEGIRRKTDAAAAVDAEIDRLLDLVRGIDASLRSELRMMHRDAVHEIGFAAALRELAETTRLESGLDVDVRDAIETALNPEVGGLLVWAAEEAIINARKHANASTISIRAGIRADAAFVEVQDDGAGIRGPRGIGLTTLAERLALAEGGIHVKSRRGHGTLLRAWVTVDRVAS